MTYSVFYPRSLVYPLDSRYKDERLTRWAGGPAFKLQKPPQLRVPRPSRTLRRAGTATASTTASVERTKVAQAASPPRLRQAQGRLLQKTQEPALSEVEGMGHPPWE